jgi:hypothetical protein
VADDIDLATHEAMGPVWGDLQVARAQRQSPLIVEPAEQDDAVAAER